MSHAVPSASQTPTPMAPLAIRAHTATTALGHGLTAQVEALRTRRSGLRINDFGEGATAEARLETWIGRVDGVEDVALPPDLRDYDCRNNRLAWLALQQDGFVAKVDDLIARHGAERVAAIIGTSTSSIGASEEAYTRLDDGELPKSVFPAELRRQLLHTPHSIGDFVRRMTGIRGPCVTVATACSSSAKVFAQRAVRLQLPGPGVAQPLPAFRCPPRWPVAGRGRRLRDP
jgi:3-oxoacyl-[acyl-carrier-protein] synthase I